jgi:hypothetical protein
MLEEVVFKGCKFPSFFHRRENAFPADFSRRTPHPAYGRDLIKTKKPQAYYLRLTLFS